MNIPILPFKIIGFTECTHTMCFLEDDTYNAIEFMKYDKSLSGKGIELIITDKENKQIIYTNNYKNYSNIKKVGEKHISVI